MSTSRAYSFQKIGADFDAEAAVIEGLHRECFVGEPYPVALIGTHWWIAYRGQTPVAFGGVRLSHNEGRAYLCRAGVTPEHRGNGLQRRLIQLRLALVRSEGIRQAVTDTVEGNCISANNLIDEGFHLFNPVTPWADDGSLYWMKDVA